MSQSQILWVKTISHRGRNYIVMMSDSPDEMCIISDGEKCRALFKKLHSDDEETEMYSVGNRMLVVIDRAGFAKRLLQSAVQQIPEWQ
jgi:hypothetical protein